jgi:hypothetical protein
MDKTIVFRDENYHHEGKKDWTDVQWIDELNKFLQGECPESIHLTRGHQPKLSVKKANAVIWYLQEHMRILPDNIEKCDNCNELFDANGEGIYWETKGKHYCGGCCDLVPYNYDRGKR